jgi:glycosyltransferase involved in cell wall biosynthesis
MISTDRSIFIPGSDANLRMKEYAALAKTLHIIVFARRKEKGIAGLQNTEIASNCIAYPTNSLNRWFFIIDAYFLAKRLFLPSMNIKSDADTEVIEDVPPVSLITTQDPFETGFVGLLVSRKLRRPLHLQVHTDLFALAFGRGSFLNSFRVRIARFLFRRRADIRVVSERIKTSIFNEMKFPFNKTPRITVLPVFVNTEQFINTPPSFDLHEQYPGFDFLVLMVARLEKEKNVLHALRLVEDIAKDKPDLSIGLVIVGSGSQERMLKNYVKRAGFADRIFFAGQQSDMVSYYKTADILLVTSMYEGYGRMYLEAAASGCPVLTPDIGAARDMLFSWNSVICPEKDNACLFRNLENLASERVLRETFLASARAGVKRMKFQTKEEYLAEYKRMWIDAAENDVLALLI